MLNVANLTADEWIIRYKYAISIRRRPEMKRLLALIAIPIVAVLINPGIVLAGDPNTNQPTFTQSGTGSAQTVSCGSKTDSEDIICIQNQSYVPATLTVGPGQIVTWVNQDTVDHTVSSSLSTGPHSNVMLPGDRYSFTFDSPGTFNYFCMLHTNMTGTVTVVPTASGAGTTTTTASTTSQPTTVAQSTTTQTQASNLPSTGPGDVIVLFAAAALSGAGLHYLLRRQIYS